MNYLLDTCVLSEFTKPRPNKKVLKWLQAQEDSTLFLSVLTIGEIEKGVAKLPESKKKNKVDAWLRQELLPRFGQRILAISREVVQVWGRKLAEAEKRGASVPVVDSLIAATALAHDLVVVTRNSADMEPMGVTVLNPWE